MDVTGSQMKEAVRFLFALITISGLFACGGGGTDQATYTIGGNLAGLVGQITLLNNGGNALTLSSKGDFTFDTTAASGTTYTITIASQPPEQLCGITNSSGTVTGKVSSVVIYCSTRYVISTFAGSTFPGQMDGVGASATFNSIRGLGIDGSGNIYVSDNGNNKIRKITSDGLVTTLAGSGAITNGTMGSQDGVGLAASFYNPNKLAVGKSGSVYVADNYGIRKIAPNAEVTTLTTAINYIGGIAVDANENVFVTHDNDILEINPSGVVTTFAGAGLAGNKDGIGTAASFYSPGDLAIDESGNIYVDDTYNNSMRMITYAGVVTTVGAFTCRSFDLI